MSVGSDGRVDRSIGIVKVKSENRYVSGRIPKRRSLDAAARPERAIHRQLIVPVARDVDLAAAEVDDCTGILGIIPLSHIISNLSVRSKQGKAQYATLLLLDF